jgi:hypothetical protein
MFCHCHGERPISALARHQLKSKPHRFGKQKRRFDSPRRPFCAVLSAAFIFGERRACMVNHLCAAFKRTHHQQVLA